MFQKKKSRWGRDFPPVQTGPGAHPASCKMGTESFPGVKCGRCVLLTTHPLLVLRSWKSRALGHTCIGITLPLPFFLICWWKESPFFVECCFHRDNPGFNFICTSLAVCYHATATAEILVFHILRLFFICRNLYWRWLP